MSAYKLSANHQEGAVAR